MGCSLSTCAPTYWPGCFDGDLQLLAGYYLAGYFGPPDPAFDGTDPVQLDALVRFVGSWIDEPGRKRDLRIDISGRGGGSEKVQVEKKGKKRNLREELGGLKAKGRIYGNEYGKEFGREFGKEFGSEFGGEFGWEHYGFGITEGI
jgi:hypothetical protein